MATLKKCSCRLQRVRGQEGEREEILWQWREELSLPKGVAFSW